MAQTVQYSYFGLQLTGPYDYISICIFIKKKWQGFGLKESFKGRIKSFKIWN